MRAACGSTIVETGAGRLRRAEFEQQIAPDLVGLAGLCGRALHLAGLRAPAVDAVALDARNLFVDCFVFPALMAGALYEGKYPLATALGRGPIHSRG